MSAPSGDRRAGRCEKNWKSETTLSRAGRSRFSKDRPRSQERNRAAIQAIRQLEELRRAEEPPGAFEDLDEVAQRRVRSRKPA